MSQTGSCDVSVWGPRLGWLLQHSQYVQSAEKMTDTREGFLFEPARQFNHDSDDDSVQSGSISDEQSSRTENLTWCLCGHCDLMPTKIKEVNTSMLKSSRCVVARMMYLDLKSTWNKVLTIAYPQWKGLGIRHV